METQGHLTVTALPDTSKKHTYQKNIHKSTQEVLRWLSDKHVNNPTKSKGRFVQFDICEFYPSISEELLGKSLTYARTHTKIEDKEVDLIMACRRSILFDNGKTWTKKKRILTLLWAHKMAPR